MLNRAMKLIKQVICGSVLLVLSSSIMASPIKSLVLHYDEAEAGAGAGVQAMRYIINDEFLRIDGGSAETDFILFDRNKKTVFSINHEDQTILKISYKPWQSPKYDFPVSIKENTLIDAPKVFGKQVFSYTVKAKDTACTKVLLVKDVHMNRLQVLYEFQNIMSGQQVATLANTPEEYQTPCFLVDQVYHKADYLKIGLPIQISYSRDYSKFLQGIKEEEVDAGLFVLPEKYEEFLPFSQ
jgi:hypothetical protein